MNPVYIVTDSAAQFPSFPIHENLPVSVVPLTLRAAGQPGKAWNETSLTVMREQFHDSQAAPFVSGASTEAFLSVYQDLQRDAEAIVSIHTSSGLCDVAAHAKEASQSLLGRCNIHVIDSQTVSVGLGLLVQAAAKAAARGESVDEIVRLVRGMLQRLYTVFCLEDLMYLYRHNLSSLSQSILGNMLGIIPCLTLEQGRLMPMEKVRSRQRAAEKLVEFVSEFAVLDHLALLHDKEEPNSEVETIAERLEEMCPDTAVTVTTYNTVLATYIGLNSLGLVVLEGEQDL